MDQDSTFLQRFLATRDEQAFAELVRTHVDLVYSAARRQVRDDAAAQDVTQQVFVLLAAKARSIRSGEAVAGWLLATTRYVALNSHRAEGRRRRHEREAAVMHEQQRSGGGVPRWEAIAPLLDEAVAKLKREDRDAVALRYFQGRSVADVAALLGVSQEAAQKRLSRAVERLRELFARRGVHTSADALSSVMMANALIAAPAALGSAVAGTALSTTTTTAAATTTSVKGAMTIMAIAKTKMVAASVAAVMLVGVTGTIAYQQIRTPGGRGRQVKLDPAGTSQPQQLLGVNGDKLILNLARTRPANPAWRSRFEAVYMLGAVETIKRVRPPMIPERLDFYRATAGQAQVQAIPTGPDLYLIAQGPQGLSSQSMTFGASSETVAGLLRTVVGVAPAETNLPRATLMRTLNGDWVYRESAPVADRMAAFTQLLSQDIGRTYRAELAPLEREVIVVTGAYAYKPLPDVSNQNGGGGGDTIHFYLGQPQKKPTGFSGSGGAFTGMFTHLEDVTGRQVIVEAKLPSRGAGSYRDHASVQSFHRMEMDAATVDALLANLANQTSFELKRERRVLPTWVFSSQ